MILFVFFFSFKNEFFLEQIEEKTQDSRISSGKPKKVHGKNKKKRNKKTPSISESEQDKATYSQQLEAKLRWAVDEVKK